MTLPNTLPHAIFFDWDGTLADSYSFLNDAHGHVLGQLGFPPFQEGEYKTYFGMPRDILYPKIYKDKFEEAKALFEIYVFENSHKIKMLEGAGEMLGVLHKLGITLGIVSNKKSNFIAREIEHFGWAPYFSSIVGAGEAQRDKPSGAPLLHGLKKINIDPKQQIVWYVGDTENDMACAQEAGCPAILMKGHDDIKLLMSKYNPLFLVENCAELKEILIAISKKSS